MNLITLILPLYYISSICSSSFLASHSQLIQQPGYNNKTSAYYEYLAQKGSVTLKSKQQKCPISMAIFQNGFPIVHWKDTKDRSQIQIFNSQKNWVLEKQINSSIRDSSTTMIRCSTKVLALKHYGLATIYSKISYNNFKGIKTAELFYQLPKQNGIDIDKPKIFFTQDKIMDLQIQAVSLKSNQNFVVVWSILKLAEEGYSFPQIKLQFFDYQKNHRQTQTIFTMDKGTTLVPIEISSNISGFSVIYPFYQSKQNNQIQIRNFNNQGHQQKSQVISCLNGQQDTQVDYCHGRLRQDINGKLLLLTSQVQQKTNQQNWMIRTKHPNQQNYWFVYQKPKNKNNEDYFIIGFQALRTGGFATIQSSQQKKQTFLTFFNWCATSWKRQEIDYYGTKAYGSSISNTQFVAAIDFGKDWGLFQTESPPIQINTPTSLIFTTDKIDNFFSLHSDAQNQNDLAVNDDVYQMKKVKIILTIDNPKWADNSLNRQDHKIVFISKQTQEQIGTSFTYQINQYEPMKLIQNEFNKLRIKMTHGLQDEFSITQQLYLDQIGFSQRVVVMATASISQGGGSLQIMWIMIGVISIIALIALICAIRRCYKITWKRRKDQKFQNLAQEHALEPIRSSNVGALYDLKQAVAQDRLKSLDLTIVVNSIIDANPDIVQSNGQNLIEKGDANDQLRIFFNQNNDTFFSGLNGTDLEMNEEGSFLFIVNLGGQINEFEQVEGARVEDILFRALKDKFQNGLESSLYLRKYLNEAN